MSPDPPPSRLRKRLRWAGLFTLLGLVLLWIAWWRIAEHQLAKRLAEIRVAGEPIEPQDFAQPSLPPEQNAATYYRQAIGLLSASALSPSNSIELKDYPPYPAQWYQMMKSAIPANAAALAAARRASQIKQVDWQYVPGSRYTVPFGGIRQLAHTLADAALDAHLRGDDAQAIERIFDILYLANAISTRMALFGRMDGLGIEAMGLDRLRTILPDLNVERTGEDSPPSLRAHYRALSQMIAMQLDERPGWALSREDLIMERSNDYVDLLKIRQRATALRPLVDLEIVRVIDGWRIELEALDAQNWAVAQSMFPEPTAQADESWLFWGESADNMRYSRTISLHFWPGNRYLVVESRLSAERRAAAVAIAICLYRSDHRQWPQALDELVPTYLAAVPRDPTVGRDAPIGYIILRGALPDGGDRPMLYFSAAPAGALPPPEPCFGWTSNQSKGSDGIQWRDLSRWSPPAPTTASAHNKP